MNFPNPFAHGSGKRRVLTPAEIRKLQTALTAANERIEEQDTQIHNLACELQLNKTKVLNLINELKIEMGRTATAEGKAQMAREDAELLAIAARSLRQKLNGRDTTDPRDRATEPIDTRTVRDEFGDDYLDRTRRAWIGPVTRIEPLYHSPLAAVIDPGQVTDDTTVEIPVLRLPAAS